MGVSLPPHNVLSPFHLDSTAASVTRGGLITGQGATPKWTLLTIGAANSVLVSDGTDVSWSTGPTVITATASQSLAANTSGDGFILTNPTAAPSSGNQQFSPRIRLTGQGWKTTATAASQTVDWIIENQPVQGTTSPTTNLVVSSQVNAGGYTAQLSLTSAGQMLGVSGSASVPTYAGTSFSSSGMWFTSGLVHISQGGTDVAAFQGSGAVTYVRDLHVGAQGGSGDAVITSDGTNIVAQKSGANGQTIRIYGTTTGSKYSFLKHDGTDGTLDVSSGKLILGGTATDIQWGKALVALGAGAAPTLGTIGGSGPATAGQNSWMQVKDSTGTAFWVPVWK